MSVDGRRALVDLKTVARVRAYCDESGPGQRTALYLSSSSTYPLNCSSQLGRVGANRWNPAPAVRRCWPGLPRMPLQCRVEFSPSRAQTCGNSPTNTKPRASVPCELIWGWSRYRTPICSEPCQARATWRREGREQLATAGADIWSAQA